MSFGSFRSRWGSALLVMFVAVGVLAFLISTTPSSAAGDGTGKVARSSATAAPAATFPGTGVGNIPDGGSGTPPVYGTPLVVSFNVSGITAPISAISVDANITHTWVGDVDAVLAAPGGSPSLPLVSRIGVTTAGSFGDSSNYGGNYIFVDSASGTDIWSIATNAGCDTNCIITPASYRTTGPGQAGQTNPPPLTSLQTTFGGLTTGQINGTWTLTFRDAAAADTGSVAAANLNITGGAAVTAQHVVDFNGDGKTDFSVVRNTGGGPSGQVSWYNCYNGLAEPGCWQFVDFGLASDFFVPADYDGDQKTDIAVWRPGTQAYFYILQSATNTVRADAFGQTGDDPTMVGDYTGDGKADPAVYRAGATAGAQSYWYYRASSGTFSGQIVYEPWGQNGDFPAPGDYDGDGKADFMVQRSAGGGQAIFWLRTNTTNNVSNYIFGTPTDVIVPGDYDGDGKTDIAVVRASGGSILWFYRKSSDASIVWAGPFGLSASDFVVQGDYDGDGKTDLAVWRPATDTSANYFYYLGSTSGFNFQEWGQNGDYPTANYNSH